MLPTSLFTFYSISSLSIEWIRNPGGRFFRGERDYLIAHPEVSSLPLRNVGGKMTPLGSFLAPLGGILAPLESLLAPLGTLLGTSKMSRKLSPLPFRNVAGEMTPGGGFLAPPGSLLGTSWRLWPLLLPLPLLPLVPLPLQGEKSSALIAF